MNPDAFMTNTDVLARHGSQTRHILDPMSRKLSKSGLSPKKRIIFLPCYRDERMLEGICAFAYKADWILDTFYYHTGILPPSWDGDGIITMLHVQGANPRLTEFIRNHSPLPTIDLSLNDSSVDLPRVLLDNRAIGRMGAEHLVSLGIRRLGFLTHTLNHFHRERYEGFRDAAKALGMVTRLIIVPDDFATAFSLSDWLVEHLHTIERPFGIMTAADYLSQWVIRGCNAENLSIPEDVAIVGVDNCREICELSPVDLSSIDNNAYQHGYEAAKLLHSIIDGHPAPAEPVRVPPGALHVRKSSSIMAARHPHVVAAMRYIAEHISDPGLTPKAVARQVPMSERRLHDVFIKYIGRSIYQEIIHRRIQYALELTQETDLKLWDIAETAGFNSPEVMSRLFSRKLGHPPSYFRQAE
jgi:LacI family transcriptional regulator